MTLISQEDIRMREYAACVTGQSDEGCKYVCEDTREDIWLWEILPNLKIGEHIVVNVFCKVVR